MNKLPANPSLVANLYALIGLLIGGTLVAFAVIKSYPAILLLFSVALAAIPFLLTARLESLLYATIIFVPFDQYKIFGILSVSNILVISMTFRCCLEMLSGKIGFHFTNIYFALVSIFCVSIISTIGGDTPMVSARQEVSFLAMILLPVLVVNICNTETIFIRVVFTVLLAGVLVSLLGMGQFVAWSVFDKQIGSGMAYYYNFLERYVYKISGPMNSSLILGTYLIPPIVIGVYLRGYFIRNKYKYFLNATLFACFIAICFTGARSAILVLLCFWLFYLIKTFNKKLQRGLKILFLPFILFFVISFVFSLPLLLNFLNDIGRLSTYNRLYIICGSIESIYEDPFFGLGLGTLVTPKAWDAEQLENFRRTVRQGVVEMDKAGSGLRTRETHNTFLQVAVDMGLVGFSIYCFFLFLVGREGLRSIKEMKYSCFYFAKKGIFVAWIFVTFCSLFTSILLLKHLWILAGLVCSGSYITKRQKILEHVHDHKMGNG
jgi:putative inorganic carbon (hco3(-)) transporter